MRVRLPPRISTHSVLPGLALATAALTFEKSDWRQSVLEQPGMYSSSPPLRPRGAVRRRRGAGVRARRRGQQAAVRRRRFADRSAAVEERALAGLAELVLAEAGRRRVCRGRCCRICRRRRCGERREDSHELECHSFGKTLSTVHCALCKAGLQASPAPRSGRVIKYI